MSVISFESCVVRRQDVLSTEISGEIVMMNIDLGEYYRLDPVAADIWRRLERPVVVATLIQEIVASYEGDPATIAADVRALLGTLAEKKLIGLHG